MAETIAGQQRLDFAHTVGFETLKAEPDQLLSYHFWAEDTGPDGQTRRTFSDMYFAEVRHFEEIFRQGQQPPNESQQQQQQQQQQSQNGNQAQKLAELQKQIINATWKLIRRETAVSPSSEYESDVNLIEQSQTTALEQTDALAEDLTDAQSLQHVEDVREHMRTAITHLTAAHDATAVAPLRPSLSSQQSAYQALLKLRAREHEVVQSSQQQSSSQSSQSSQSRAQQQLQQLQLDKDENRYETQREAQSQQEQQDQETQQVLNRLRELARRQNDLNERLKELQSALEEAQTTQEREELERQLKRLREEEQELMRDAEELESRMEQPENQERMSESREQLSETRENMREASEALKEGQISRAITSGTRAERELEELRDDFRKQSSDRFAEEMRDMREQARALDEKQQELGDRLGELTDPQPTNNSLRDNGEREKIAEELGQQQERLDDLLDRMTDTIMDAETTEPLLANELYDTLRKTQQAELNRDLQSAEQSLKRGLLDDAVQREEIAGEGIGQLREGVERAAERVVGDETEALQRARQQLDELTEELNDEVSRSTAQQRENSTESQP
ncbi:MAG: hypothetical protein QGF59_00545, partial [Pirellulaceae bacterium]|nr:hypothetical protein [Pirellulaceae bacterium]